MTALSYSVPNMVGNIWTLSDTEEKLSVGGAFLRNFSRHGPGKDRHNTGAEAQPRGKWMWDHWRRTRLGTGRD
jgi:hypothetical protein